jgi:small-conductance mechanosensitive channel
MWERPIRIGDFLEVADARGRVEAIDARSTRIRRTDGVHLLIPNSHLLENTVVNWTLVDNLARSEVKVGVAYGSPVKRVAELFQEIMEAHADVLADPEPVVFFEDFGDSALLFGGYFWVNAHTEKDLRKIRSDLRFAIDEAFSDNDIVIAFPQRDVHLNGALTLHQSEQRETAS